MTSEKNCGLNVLLIGRSICVRHTNSSSHDRHNAVPSSFSFFTGNLVGSLKIHTTSTCVFSRPNLPPAEESVSVQIHQNQVVVTSQYLLLEFHVTSWFLPSCTKKSRIFAREHCISINARVQFQILIINYIGYQLFVHC